MDLRDVRKLLTTFPAVTEEPHFELWSARVGGKIFATWPADGSELRVFVDAERARTLAAAGPWQELWWGKTLSGVRVALPGPASIAEVLKEAWARKAPKRLR